VTLIPTFACDGGFVIHADSEENCGTFRRAVQKITPRDMGQLRVVIAGSGIGDLIDSFTAKLKERLDRDNASDVNEVKRLIDRRLPNFLNIQVANFPCADDAKLHKFIVGAYAKTGKFAVWASHNDVLIPVTSYEMAGVEDKVYDHVMRRFYRPNMTFSQAILAGLYVLTVAESTSPYVRGPYQVAVISRHGIEMEKEENVRAMTERLSAYEQQINDLFIACANTRITVPEFEDLVDAFKITASTLHRDHIDQQATRTSLKEILEAGPLSQIRGHIVVGTQSYRVEHDRREIQKAKETLNKLRLMGNAGPITVTVHCRCGTDFKVDLPDFAATATVTAPCTKCGKENNMRPVDLVNIELKQ